MNGKYFNTGEQKEFKDTFNTLRVVGMGGDESGDNGWQVTKGGSVDSKGRLKNNDVVAWCKTKEEAEQLVEKLCAII